MAFVLDEKGNYLQVYGESAGGGDSANKDLSNLSSTGKAVIDGQFVSVDGSKQRIASKVVYDPTDTTPIEYSLSSILPDDNYNYLVLFRITTISSASGYYTVPVYTSILTNYMTVAFAQNMDNWSNFNFQEMIYLPIGSDHKIYVTPNVTWITGGKYDIDVMAYRRLGTNQ